ncbi:MAG: hypothetical protein K0S71_1220 [Clostridia bacterium]|jgi:regulation of enolase protein 1 (concanavalin A-like superfamily)|nr:hypothetical protein [Clostridia bacterium]
MDFSNFRWINKPNQFEITDKITITTDPETDYWQKTYYGFSNDNAHAFVTETEGDFSFTIKTEFDSKRTYDQCGIIMYQDSNNWIKASIEHEDGVHSRLGSVVTNLGYSDWATTDISSDIKEMYYRLSRRGQDFYIENSYDGKCFKQMRMLHMHQMIHKAAIGIYACSPLKSSFKCTFSEMLLETCKWRAYETPNQL